MRAKLFTLGVLFAVLCFYSVSSSDVPQMINYQGKLTRPQGGLINATVSMIFTIYDDSTEGTVLWTETQDSIVVERSIFSVLLGSANEIPDSVFDGSIRYLSVKVGDDSEMIPRKAIVSVGYAYRSEYADTADYAQVAVSDGDWTIDGGNIYRLTGRVGIGTTSPDVVLDIEGTQSISPTSDGIVNIGQTSGYHLTLDNNEIHGRNGTDPADLYINYFGGDVLIARQGNVGIGTMNPQGKLDIDGSLAVAGDEGSAGQVLTSQGAETNPVWSEVTAVPADNSVSQAKLKTATGEVSTSSDATLILPGGEYGFYPQIKMSGTNNYQWAAVPLGNWDAEHLCGVNGWTSYITSMCVSIHYGDGTFYAQQRYVTSSGKDYWMFFLIDKNTKQVIGGYQAPDHPCYGSGGDESDIPHPFGSYDPEKHDVILIDNEILPELKSKVTSRRSLLTVINEEYEIDFDSEPVYQPREIIEIDEYGDKEGEILQKIKTPEWAKILIGKDEIYLKRRLVETLPDYISYKKLRPKSETIAEAPVLSQRTESQLDIR